MTARILSLQDVAAARRFYEAGLWQPWTMYQRLRELAERRPDAIAVIDSAASATLAELVGWVDAFAAVLHEAGLRPGDRVAIWSPSRLESVATLLACSRMGYVCVPSLHRDHTPDGVLRLLQRAKAAALVFQRGYGANAAGRDMAVEVAQLPSMKHIIALDPLVADSGPETPRFGGLVPRRMDDLAWTTNPDRVMYLAFTSGTTGEPKGVMHSDNTLLANGRAIARDFGFGEETVVYTFSPMSHNMGTVSLVTMLACGGSLVVHSPLDAHRALKRIISTRATYLVGVPTHGIDLVAQLGPDERLGQAQVFQLAGSPVPPRLAEALIGRGVRVQNCFGMTENCSFLYTRAEDPVEVVTQSCGRCCEGMELAIFDPENSDRPVPVGEAGEVGVRGASLMLGYYDDQSNTEASFNASGWFMTGDLGRIGEDGNVRIIGRKKDLIIRGGHNIYPAAIENTVMRHEAVSTAAAFAVPDERLGERVCLAVTPARAGDILDPYDLLAHLADHGLSIYEMPEYFTQLESFPLTASGKILKRELAEMVKDGRLSPQPIRWSGKK